MKTYDDVDISTNVQRIEVVSGVHYNQCRATVAVDISDGNGRRKEMVVEYPMQGDLHITALMQHKGTNKDVSHDVKMSIAEAIDNIVKGK